MMKTPCILLPDFIWTNRPDTCRRCNQPLLPSGKRGIFDGGVLAREEEKLFDTVSVRVHASDDGYKTLCVCHGCPRPVGPCGSDQGQRMIGDLCGASQKQALDPGNSSSDWILWRDVTCATCRPLGYIAGAKRPRRPLKKRETVGHEITVICLGSTSEPIWRYQTCQNWLSFALCESRQYSWQNVAKKKRKQSHMSSTWSWRHFQTKKHLIRIAAHETMS